MFQEEGAADKFGDCKTEQLESCRSVSLARQPRGHKLLGRHKGLCARLGYLPSACPLSTAAIIPPCGHG